MKRDNRFRIGLVIVFIIGSIWSLLPTLRVVTMNAGEKTRMRLEEPQAWQDLESEAIKLGLDLKGGMHLVLEIDLEEIPVDAREDAQERFVGVIRNRIDQYGISEPIIQTQGRNRVIIQLAGVDDPERARDLVGRTAVLTYNLLKSGDILADLVTRINRTLYDGLTTGLIEREQIGFHLVEPETAGLPGITGLDSTASDTTAIPQNPLNSYLLIDPNAPDVVWAREDRMAWVDSILALPQVSSLIPGDAEFHWAMWADERFTTTDGTKYRELYLTEGPVITGDMLESADVSIGGPQDPDAAGQPVVNFRMNTEGGRVLARMSRANINRRMAIILDSRVAVAPVIQSTLGRDSRITGIGDHQEARNISITLESGALPAPAHIVENRTISPSLGTDSIKSGTISTLIGLIAVLIFMIAYYRGSGLIANFALMLNILFILAVLAGFGFTLTLPGIAGIILTMGMAVDANVLIYDRIKEELRAGKTIRAAVESGYANATSAILDANITTLITALVLYQFGTGPIRGFALTLSVGIISSVFTALIVTRLMFDRKLDQATTQELSI
ncbi:protein translocase subunit SecD [Candidatus Zixiibacteriota bacterium]